MGSAPSPSEADGSTLRADGPGPYLRIQSVTIFVRDLDRSLRFYLDQLGFHLAFDARVQSGRRWAAVAPPDGAATLTLVAPEPDSEEYKLIGRPTQVAFVTEDVVAKFHQWSRRGVRFQYAPRLKRLHYEVRMAPRSTDPSRPAGERRPIWGGVYTRFRDLDGNSFALLGFDDLSREIEAQRRALAEKV